MRRVVAAALACFALSAYAADPERLREAHAVFDAMHLDKQMDAMMKSMGQAMATQFATANRDPRVTQISMEEAMAVMKERSLEPGGLVDSMAEAYADVFTIDELRELRRFYESPAGQKLLSKIPEMLPRVMQQSMARAKESIPLICSRTKARLVAEGLEAAANNMKCQ